MAVTHTIPLTMRRTLLRLGVLALLAACGDDTTTDGTHRVEQSRLVDPQRIDATLEGFVDRGELIGISALVYEHGKEAYFGAFGLADREANRPMRRDTLVPIFSMTKPITGVTLMTFYEEGRFELDDPLEDYLPEYKDIPLLIGEKDGKMLLASPARKPTIRDILRHTAGFTNNDLADSSAAGDLFRAINPLDINNTLEQMSQKLASIPLFYEPGTRWFYGPSADVQARLVEVLSGRKFKDVMQERVLGPLGMTETQYTLRPDQRDRITPLYLRNPDGSFERIPDEIALETHLRDVPLTPGGQGLSSTLDDYMRFTRMLLNGGELDGVRILQAETVRLMATDAMPADVTDTLWLHKKGQVGFGIDFAVRVAPPVDQAESSGAVGEFFWDGAANTLFWVDPKNDITAVQFNFYQPWGKVEMQKDFRDAVYYRDEEANAMNKAPAGPNSNRGSD
jgi:CubicO group peptidase (beta-lactamase class C family)